MSGPLGSQQWMYSTGFYPHEIDQSLRFNDDDTAYLSRTPASAGDRKTWTWSGWFKRANISVDQVLFSCYFANNDSSQFNITDEMSVSAWINLDSNSGWKGIFGGAESGFVHFQLYDGGINVYVYGPAAAYGNPDGITIGTNVWTNVGFTFGNNTLKVYLNGEQLTTTVTGNGGNISSNSDVRFGWAYATSRLFQGKINALTVHNRALTAEEVAENFNGIRSRFGI